MRTIYISFYIVLAFSFIVKAQDITATLAGNTSGEGFSVINAQGDTLFRITGEGLVGIQTSNPSALLDIQSGETDIGDGKSINLIAQTGNFDAGAKGGDVNIVAGNGGNGGGNIKIISGDGGDGDGGDIDIIAERGEGPGGNLTLKTLGGNGPTGDITLFTGASNGEDGNIYLRTSGSGSQNGNDNIKLETNYESGSKAGGSITLKTGFCRFDNNIILDAGDWSDMTEEGGNIILTTGNLLNSSTEGLVEINGSGTYTGTWTQISDERFKKNIEPLNNSIDKIEKLEGISYEFKAEEYPEKHFAKERQIGMIAQDVEKVFPELVKTDNEGYKSIAYQNMVAVLIEAVKEQQQSIKMLSQRIETLEKENGGDDIKVTSLDK